MNVACGTEVRREGDREGREEEKREGGVGEEIKDE